MSKKNGVLIVNVDPDHHRGDNISTKTIISTTGTTSSQQQQQQQQKKNKNITKVNLDYNDNKTIITINGDGGGEIFWSANSYEQQSGKHLNGTNGNIWVDDATSRNSHDSDHGSSSINSSIVEERHRDHDDDGDDENGGEEFNLSDSEFEEILDEHDDVMDTDELNNNDDENYQSCDDSAITEDMKTMSNTDNDEDDNDKFVHDDKCNSTTTIGQQLLSTTTTHIEPSSIGVVVDCATDKLKNVELINSTNNQNNNSVCDENTVESRPVIVNGAGDSMKIVPKMSSQSSLDDCDNVNKLKNQENDDGDETINETVNVALVNRTTTTPTTVDPVHQQQSKVVAKTTSRQTSMEPDEKDAHNLASSRRQSIHQSHLYDEDQEDDGVFVDIMGKANEIVGFFWFK